MVWGVHVTLKTGLYVVHATARHARQLGPNLREVDKAEIKALSGMEPIDALTLALNACHEVFTVKTGADAVGMFGHSGTPDGIGCIWMVGSPRLTEDVPDFWDALREWWDRMTFRYAECRNSLMNDNRLHRMWLYRMGCVFGDPWPALDDNRTLFRTFTYVRPDLS